MTANGRDIGITKWGDEVFAVRNYCPHAEGPLCDGVIRSRLVTNGTFDQDVLADPSRPVIVCPWHHIEWDLRTGLGLRRGSRVQTYPVSVVDGRVLVNVGGSPGSRTRT